jgi:Ser/Thr protein kinase RdoA (MazF antagonist)
MIDTNLKNFIIQKYSQIDKITLTKEIKEGYLSNNHILNTKKTKYFLKQYREVYTEEAVSDVHKVINFFFAQNIPVVSPIKNINGESYFIFNSRIYTLFPFIEASIGDRKNISQRSIKSLARTLAKIHLLSSDGIPFEINSQQGSINREDFLKTYSKIKKAIKSKNTKDDFDKMALQALELKKSLADKNVKKVKNLSVINDHLIHGDYHEKNVFLDSNGNVKYVFDWEKTEIGNRLHELIRSMDFVCLNGQYKQENIEKARVYIQSYKELYPFNKEAFLNSIEAYYLKNAHSLWIEKTHYLENSNRVDCFLENQLALLQYYPENIKHLVEKLKV